MLFANDSFHILRTCWESAPTNSSSDNMPVRIGSYVLMTTIVLLLLTKTFWFVQNKSHWKNATRLFVKTNKLHKVRSVSFNSLSYFRLHSIGLLHMQLGYRHACKSYCPIWILSHRVWNVILWHTNRTINTVKRVEYQGCQQCKLSSECWCKFRGTDPPPWALVPYLY